MRRILLILSGLLLSFAIFAAEARAQEPVLIPSATAYTVPSELNGVTYQLTVVLPDDYESNPTARYPTFYVLDGNRWASVLALLLPRFTQNNGLPPFILVGIDYPGDTGRYQDYGPVSQRYFPVPEHRGAANFLRVVRREIVPFVESRYRTDPNDRGIGGHSMGGLFAAYALLHAPDTFQRFWISSPSLFYDDEVVFEEFPAFQRRSIRRPLYVFTDIGANELPTMIGALERFGQRLVQAQPEHIVLDTLVVPGANHATVVPSAFAPAFEHLYRHRPQFTLAASELYRFAGQYRLQDGDIITLMTDGRDLMYGDSSIDFQHGALVRLTAGGPNSFYQRGAPTEIEFPESIERPQILRIRGRDGAWEEAVRMPSGLIEPDERPVILGRP